MAQSEVARSSQGKVYARTDMAKYQNISIQVNSGNWQDLGFYVIGDGGTLVSKKQPIFISVYIPEKFEIISANIKIYHAPKYWENLPQDSGTISKWCTSKNIRLYKTNNLTNYYSYAIYESGIYTEGGTTLYTEIVSALGIGGFNPTAPVGAPPISSAVVETVQSSDIKDHLISGVYNYLKLETAEITPIPIEENKNWLTDAYSKTGLAMATLNIVGYIKG